MQSINDSLRSTTSDKDEKVQRKVNYTSVLDGEDRTLTSDQIGYGACRRVNEFTKIERVGEGTYGIVYKAKDCTTNEVVALKQVRIDKNVSYHGMSDSALREITILKRLRHENIVWLKGVAVTRDIRGMYLIMEYCEQDLGEIMDARTMGFTPAEVKCLGVQLFRALDYLHDNFILHRDLKVTNLLMTDGGILKVADFGLARSYGYENMPMTPKVVTLWYRCPELLLGSLTQTPGVDVWAAGCVLAELMTHKPLFPAKTEIEAIDMIINLFGTPSPKIWVGMENLPYLKEFDLKVQPFNNIKMRFESATPAALNLLNSVFTYDPAKRISAKNVLQHAYFEEEFPKPLDPALMPIIPRRKHTSSSHAVKRKAHSPL